MNRADLIELIDDEQSHLLHADVEAAVKFMIDQLGQELASGGRVEIRGFGSFSLHYRKPRSARNPKTGESVALQGRYAPHFKPGKELRDRVNATSLVVANFPHSKQ